MLLIEVEPKHLKAVASVCGYCKGRRILEK